MIGSILRRRDVQPTDLCGAHWGPRGSGSAHGIGSDTCNDRVVRRRCGHRPRSLRVYPGPRPGVATHRLHERHLGHAAHRPGADDHDAGIAHDACAFDPASSSEIPVLIVHLSNCSGFEAPERRESQHTERNQGEGPHPHRPRPDGSALLLDQARSDRRIRSIDRHLTWSGRSDKGVPASATPRHDRTPGIGWMKGTGGVKRRRVLPPSSAQSVLASEAPSAQGGVVRVNNNDRTPVLGRSLRDL